MEEEQTMRPEERPPLRRPVRAIPQQQEEKRERISKIMGAALVITALFIDVIELILEWLGIGLVTNIATTPPAFLIFWIWFKMLDVPFIASPKRFFTLAATCLAELIPALDASGFGFFWTAGTLIIIIMVRTEDKGGILGKLSGTTMALMKTRYTNYKRVFDSPEKLKLAKENLKISKQELISETFKRNPGTDLDRYDKTLDKTRNILNKKSNKKSELNVLDLKNKDKTDQLSKAA